MLSYAGIGSRSITPLEQNRISHIATKLSKHFVLYSGNADGADIAFQKGSQGQCVLMLPWAGFNKQNYDMTHCLESFVVGNTTEALQSVKDFHPNPGPLSRGVRCLMARNYHQVFGVGKYPKVSFVVCCADEDKKGNVKGGTGQAVRLAISESIPVINIRSPYWRHQLRSVCLDVKGK